MRLIPELWRKGELEKQRTLEPAAGLGARVDRLDRAFQSELTSSMSLNVRGTAMAAVSAIAILLLAEFSTTWLDDTRWVLPDFADIVMKWLLPAAVGLLALCILISAAAVWPKRRWAGLQQDRLVHLSSGDAEAEAAALLAMVESQRRVNERRSRHLRVSAAPLLLALIAIAGQCLIFAVLAEPVEALCTGSTTPAAAADAGLPTRAEQERLAGIYAPRVWLHRSERYGPLDPAAFVRSSRLTWKKRRGTEEVVERGKVDPARLGRDCDQAANGCYRHSDCAAREMTRPFEGSKPRPRGLGVRLGFALEPSAEGRGARVSQNSRAPMFWEFRRTSTRLLITYWFYYGYSRPNDPRTEALGDVSSHDGDWENIEVALEPNGRTPVAVYFYGHGDPSRTPWEKVCKVRGAREDCSSERPGHPVVYSALSSHASYPEAESYLVHGDLGNATDVTGAGWRWESWDQPGGLRPVRDEPWYGFGGAWGRAKQIPGTTGPLGPSQWKLPADPDPGDLASGPAP